MSEVQPRPQQAFRGHVNFGKKKPPKLKFFYCLLCRLSYPKITSTMHMHSLMHHQELEVFMGNVGSRDYIHQCFVCSATFRTLADFSVHISTPLHKSNLKGRKLMSLNNTLPLDIIHLIQERNKMLGKAKRKIRVGKRKQERRLQKFAQQQKQQQEKSNQVHQAGKNETVVQNKENKVACVQRPVQQIHTQAQNQSGPSAVRDVPSMLKQLRRELGVREPCRAEREARKQNVGTAQLHPDVYSPVWSDQAAPADPQPSTSKTTQEPAQPGVSRSIVSDRRSPGQDRESLTVSASATSRKVRIAHQSASPLRGREAGLKSTVNKLLTSSGAISNSWMELYNDIKKKKKKQQQQKKFIGTPRFGIEFANPPTVPGPSAAPPPNRELPLSEGFHWDTVPHSPAGTPLALPPAPRDTNPSHALMQDPPPPPVDQGGGSPAVPVKTESEWRQDGVGVGDDGSAKKRQLMGDFDKEPTGKKKKAKSHKGRDDMDQLLAVSLREDELSRSMEDLDKSLVQARTMLQAAYADLQRLLLTKQQFTAEINTLRAKRIEILQLMQEGYTGGSSVQEKAGTSSAGAAPVQPRLSPRPLPPPPSAFQASSLVPQPHSTPLAVMPISVKQEPCSPPAAVQPNQSVSSSTDSPQVPLKVSVAAFPLYPLPPVLNVPVPTVPPPPPPPPSPPLPPAAAASTSVRNISPELSVKQQQHQQKSNDCVEAATTEKVLLIVSDSEEEPRRDQVNTAESAAEKPAPGRDRRASAAEPVVVDDDGDESDGSVKIVEPSVATVIDVDESGDEGSPEIVADAPLHLEPQQKTTGVEISCASPQTTRQKEPDGKIPVSCPVKDDCSPADISDCVEDEEPSLGSFQNHAGPVHGIQIHEGLLYTCSADNTARAYCLKTRECVAVFEGHSQKVNCLLVSSAPNMPARLYTGSSDETVLCYGLKSKRCLGKIIISGRVLCLHVAWNILYVGLANGSVHSFDLRTQKPLNTFECHGPRGVSCLGTAQEGARRLLLVGSYDSTISVRDAKNGLLLRSLQGHTKTVLCMKVVNDLVFSGSSDTSVHSHNIHTGELLRIYKGHGHSVTSIAILGKVMVTACLDKLVRVYELQSHDRLQVYCGHSDLVMCMVIHKSVIYTGCYDGTIQAVKLNLMENYRCWWHSCSLIFGMREHLHQHLIGDHTNKKLQMLKCRWRDCDSFFPNQHSVLQKLPDHMMNHVERDSEIQP